MRQRTLFMTGAVGLIGLFCALVFSGGGVSSTTAGQADDVPSDFRPSTDVTIAGPVSVSTWEIPEGVTVSVPRDLIVDCSGDIVIDGRLIAEQAGSADFGNGTSITLRTPGTVRLSGLIQAGNGAESPLALGSSGNIGLIGGRGGDVTIEAAAVIGIGEIRAGDGGAGLLGGPGGEGGRVVIEAATASSESDTPMLAQGGAGGRGGEGVPEFNSGTGGPGGDGGDALIVPAGDGTPGDPGSDDIKTGCAANGLPWSSCGSLNFHPAGYPGASAVGGAGGDGGDCTTMCGNGGNGGRGGNAQSQCGGNGTSGLDCETGGFGANGGSGGSATGGRGGNGGDGESCCCGMHSQGGNGGSGGSGGNATSGNGGGGGKGGNSTHTPIPWAGGNGGNGGNGGAATGGHGGDGGNGAIGTPVGTGGLAGLGGTASAGSGGSGAAGGTGIPPGALGTTGAAGMATQGAAGAAGNPGIATCVQLSSSEATASIASATDPPPSPGAFMWFTAIDEQSRQSGGYHIGRNSPEQAVHFCWTHLGSIPTSASDENWEARYGDYDQNRWPFEPALRTASLGPGTKYPNLAMDDKDHAHLAFEKKCDPNPADYSVWTADFPSYCAYPDAVGEVISCDAPCPYVEPRIAISKKPGAPDLIHVIARPSLVDCPDEPLAYWRYDGMVWSGPALIDVTPGYEYSIAADPLSGKVAIVLYDASGGLLNVAYYESTSYGTGWLDGSELGLSSRYTITNYTDPVAGVQAGYHTSVAYDYSSDLHILWDERQPSHGSTATFIRHWSSQTGVIRPVAAALWENPASTGSFDLNFSKISMGVGDGSTTCLGGAESNLGYLYVVYTQFGGPTPGQQADHSATGYMNGDLYLTVSRDGGMSWAPPQDLTNTRTPRCNPGPADPGTGIPHNPDSVCRSESWASISQIVDDIDILFISDVDAGAATRGEGTWQLNSVHYLNLSGSGIAPAGVCPLIAPVFEATLSSDPLCDYHATRSGAATAELQIMNLGNATLNQGLGSGISVTDFPGLPSLTLTGHPLGAYSIPAGSPDIEMTVTMAANNAAEDVYLGQISISHNDSDPDNPSPHVYPIEFFVFDDFTCDNLVLRTGVSATGSVALSGDRVNYDAGSLMLRIGPDGRFTSQDSKGGLWRAKDSSSTIFDGSLLLAHGAQGTELVVFHHFYERDDPGQNGFTPVGFWEIDTAAYGTGAGYARARGRFVTSDSIVGFDIDWVFPQDLNSDEFVLVRYTVYGYNTTPVSDLYLGLLADNDILPAARYRAEQTDAQNLGFFDALNNLLAQRGSGGPNPEKYGAAIYFYHTPGLFGGYIGSCESDLDPGGGPTSEKLYSLLQNVSGPELGVYDAADLYTLAVPAQNLDLGPNDTVSFVLALISDTLLEPTGGAKSAMVTPPSLIAKAQQAAAFAAAIGFETIFPSTCVCDCHGDPGGNCDGDPTVLDVVSVVNSAFRNIAPTPDPSASCPYYPVDVDCSHSVDVLDAVKMVAVTFRNANPATEFCNPCAP